MNCTASSIRSESKTMAESNRGSRPVAVRVDDDKHILISLLARTSGKILPQIVREIIDFYVLQRLMSSTLDSEINEAKERFGEAVEVLKSGVVDIESAPVNSPHNQGHQITLRVSQTTFARLNALALVDNNTMADQIRGAIELHLNEENTKQHIEFAKMFNSEFVRACLPIRP